MVTSKNNDTAQKKISVLVADDSGVFRRFLADILMDHEQITIIGEAKNGIEALDLILKLSPDVILMDMEMPLMDGMTALQHLMIHCPTPTIILSSLTYEGTARSFDAIKNGAVDFLSKDLLFESGSQPLFADMVIRKILGAVGMSIVAKDPVIDLATPKDAEVVTESIIVFCEDCGCRNVVEVQVGSPGGTVECKECGDKLEFNAIPRYRRNNFVTVFGGGEGCFRSLLNIIPLLDDDLGGAVVAVISASESHINEFVDYLNSISSLSVLRGAEGMQLEAGCCYILSQRDLVCLRQFSANHILEKADQTENGVGPVDMMMSSVATVFKEKSAGVLLSGAGNDGVKGLATVLECSGCGLVLSPKECLVSDLVRRAVKECDGVEVQEREESLFKRITELFNLAKKGSSAA